MKHDVIIEARELVFRYQPHMEPALDGVDLTIHEGEFVALLGQNGAGKTTIAKHFNGLLLPSEGEVLIRGRPSSKQRLWQLARGVGYCYQNPDHQIFSSTVEKEVRFGPANVGMQGKELQDAVDEALDLVGLSHQRDVHPFSLGQGQRQLLAVASVLAMNPPMLVVDEPTTGMDHLGAVRIMDLLAEWNQDGRTIVVITHDMDIVAEYVPRSVFMSNGRIVHDGPTLKVFDHQEALVEARLHEPSAVRISRELSPWGVQPSGSIASIAEQVANLCEGHHAGRV